MTDHTVKSYDEDLSRSQDHARADGRPRRGAAGARPSTRCRKRDTQLADRVIADDDKIDALELRDRGARHAHHRQAPADGAATCARSWSAIRIAADLERIGDLAKNIAKRTHAMSDSLPRQLVTGLKRMGKLAQEQLKDVLDAYTRRRCTTRPLEVWRRTRRSTRSTIRSSASS